MITKEVIDSIYKQYKSRPSSPDNLNLGLLFDYAIDNHAIFIDDGNLVIDSVNPDSPFHSIPLRHIHEILEFENSIGIVLDNSIIFLNKHDDAVHVHLRMQKPTLMDRARELLRRDRDDEF
ncbi:MAG: hypothetical protein NC187_04335 [Candidatus Amulumruptor caecigallinarius]|nr:hypothetical protein [Candidatus Amulumruptor caecigallinarius]MCM1396701.1 hypothetical protein [Candidatus Amulumruptor caecigallinarius]MCM1453241.1 hypothetical protein [bacterium]